MNPSFENSPLKEPGEFWREGFDMGTYANSVYIYLSSTVSGISIHVCHNKHNLYTYIYVCAHMYVCILSHFSCVQLFATLWTEVCQAPLSMGFSRQEYWNGLPCLSGNLPD